MDEDYNHLFKIVLMGSAGTGKSKILERFVRNTFRDRDLPTIGVEFCSKIIEIKGTKVKLQIWDTAGQERYRAITLAHLRRAVGILLVYDITDIRSFQNLRNFYNEVQQSAADAQIILVGNKKDMEKEQMVTYEEGKKYADEIGADILEVSALSGEGVKNIFTSITETILDSLTGTVSRKKPEIIDDADFEKGLYFLENQNEKPSDYMVKILLLGHSNSGKSSVLTRYVENTFNEVSNPSKDIVERTKIIELSGKVLKLQLFDTPGDSKFSSKNRDHYGTANSVVLMYDVTNTSSFENIKTWHSEIKGSLDEDARVFVVGNKVDMKAERKVSAQEAKIYANDRGAYYLEVSAKSNQNIEEAFKIVCGQFLATL